MKSPQNDLGGGKVGIAGTGIVTFNQGSWYDPTGAEDEDDNINAKLDEMSLAEPSVHSWDDSEMDPKSRKGISAKISNMLVRVGGTPTNKGSKRMSKSKYSSNHSPSASPTNAFETPTRSWASSPTHAQGIADESEVRTRDRSASKTHNRRPSGDRKSLQANTGPQRAAVVPAVVAATRLHRMHRQGTSGPGTAGAPSLRKLRQIARKVKTPGEVDTAPQESVLENAVLRGQGPGVHAIAQEEGSHSPVGPSGAPYLMVAADAHLPNLDILANLEHVSSPNRDDDLHVGQSGAHGVVSPQRRVIRPPNTAPDIVDPLRTPMHRTLTHRPTYTRARDKAAKFTPNKRNNHLDVDQPE